MAFDGIARALLTGTAGYLEGQQLRGEDERARAKEKAQADLEAAAAKREAQNDAVMNLFRQSQIKANDALAYDRMTPDVAKPPTPRTSVRQEDDGTFVIVDEATGTARPVTRADGSPVRGRVAQSGGGGVTPAQSDQHAREEAEGLAIYNTSQRTPELSRLISEGFQQARRAGSTLSPGRLTLQVVQGLRRIRPDLFRLPSQGGGESATDRLERMALDESGPGYDGAPQAQVAPGLTRPVPADRSFLDRPDASDLDGDAPMTEAEIQQFRGLVALSPDPRQALLDAGLTPEEVAQVLP